MLSVRLETTSGEIVKMLGHLNLIGRALLANSLSFPLLASSSRDLRLFFYFLTEKERDRRVFVLAGLGTVQIVRVVKSRGFIDLFF
jgi:hypothetical protein